MKTKTNEIILQVHQWCKEKLKKRIFVIIGKSVSTFDANEENAEK